MWNWDNQDPNQKAETKLIDQVEMGGAGAKVELPELAYDYSPHPGSLVRAGGAADAGYFFTGGVGMVVDH